MKKIVSIFLVFCICILCIASVAFGQDVDKSENKIIFEKNTSNFKQAEGYIKYEYKDVETKYPHIEGYADGQPSEEGTRLATSGGFFWCEGGYNKSVSVSFGDFTINVSSSLGQIGTDNKGTTRFISVPNTTDYFKLYVIKTMKVKKIAVYGYKLGSNNKEFLYYIYKQSLDHIDFEMRKG